MPATSVRSSNGTVVGGRPIDTAIASTETSVVLPPDSEIVAPFSVSGVRPNCRALVEPSGTLTEGYGVIVGHTLVDASSRTASVLMVNPNAEEVVLPSFTCVGKLVPEIVTGSHPSLGDPGCHLLRDPLYHYRHIFSGAR